MIKSFKHRGLESFFNTVSKAGIQPAHAKKLALQLGFLDAAQTPGNMGVEGWDLHSLKGTMDGHWSVKVNGNWLLTFKFIETMHRLSIIRTTTRRIYMPMFNPPHPGAGIRSYMGDRITVSELARHVGMTRANLSMIQSGRLGISAAMAIKLSEAFPNSDEHFWLTLQNNYDLARARRKKRAKIKPVLETEFRLAA